MSARHIGAPLCDTHERVERRDPAYWEPEPLSHGDIAREFRRSLWMLPVALLLILAIGLVWGLSVTVFAP
jgi:hypothetical protein